MAVTDLFARRATLAQVVAAAAASSASSSATRPGSTARSPTTPPQWSPTCGSRRRRHGRRAAHCSTSAAAPVTSPRRSADAGMHYIGVEPDPAEMHAGPCGGRSRRHLRAGIGDGAAVRRRQRRHLPVVQRRRARRGSRGGWAARCCASPSPAAWWCCRTRCGWARSAATKRGCGITSAAPARPDDTPASTAIAPKNNYGSSLFAVSVADGLDWAASTGALARRIPPLPPAMGAGGWRTSRCSGSSW